METPLFNCPCCKRSYFKSKSIIDVGKGNYVLVDIEDYDDLIGYKWHLNPSGYPARMGLDIDGKRKIIYMHRQIMCTPSDMVVDHINSDKLDNRKRNLRNCTAKQNMANVRKSRSSISKYRGLSFYKTPYNNYWVPQIGQVRLGYFLEEHHAALAHDLWAVDIHGEYARTNFPVVAHS